TITPGKGAAPSRSKVNPVRPRRLSHVLLFSSDVPRSVRFYTEALGLRLSDHSGDLIAFLHGAHASDHHMLAFAKSDGPGLHHSSWDVATLDDVGIGMQQMIDRGYPDGWRVGRSGRDVGSTGSDWQHARADRPARVDGAGPSDRRRNLRRAVEQEERSARPPGRVDREGRSVEARARANAL